MKPELIVALDVSSTQQAVTVVDKLPPEISWFKIGLELFCAEGPQVVEAVAQRGKQIFLDLKLHDIPRTVERAVKSAAQTGAGLITVHACGGKNMIQAAAQAAQDCSNRPRIIAVTMLTSLDQNDLSRGGIHQTPADFVMTMAELAISSGADGLVSSPQEVEGLRTRLGPQPILVTPGIRPANGATGDQKRTGTPAMAVRAGSTFLVVGRPILEATDPQVAALGILKEMTL